MKSFIVPASFLILSALVLSCADSGVEDATGNLHQAPGNVSLSFSEAPPEISRVVARISRSGFAPRSLELIISDSTHSASGGFDDVAVGVWHLRVEAFDTASISRYAGETDVEVRPGQVSQVALQLLPTSGGIHIVVTWGPPPSPNGGLMAYYPFNGNANDVSGNGNNGFVSGATPSANRHGNPNSAFVFDGLNDMISIPSSPSLNPFNQLTIAFWIRVDSMQNNYLSVLHKGGEAQQQPYLGNREYAVYLKQNFSLYYFQMYSAGDGNGQHYVLSYSFEPHQWLFFTAVIDRQAHHMKCYMNGALNSDVFDEYSSFNINNFPLTIGTEAETVWPDHSPFFGALDELRLYNRALTPPEIQSLYNMP